jgi:hypothetical protein
MMSTASSLDLGLAGVLQDEIFVRVGRFIDGLID